jgi:hypothetical protein
VVSLEPVTLTLQTPRSRRVRQRFLQIFQRPERTLVAILELLSPSNKTGGDRGAYLRKRNTLFARDVHVFELDLLLGGRRLPLREPLPRGDYYAFISRADRRPKCEVYSWTVRDRLPTLPVPLKSPDADVTIDLQAVFATTYERGRYRRSLRYQAAPHVPLPVQDQDWVVQTARSALA